MFGVGAVFVLPPGVPGSSGVGAAVPLVLPLGVPGSSGVGAAVPLVLPPGSVAVVTVTEQVAILPFAVVAMIIAEPADMPTTKPFVTMATSGVEEDQLTVWSAVLGVTVAVSVAKAPAAIVSVLLSSVIPDAPCAAAVVVVVGDAFSPKKSHATTVGSSKNATKQSANMRVDFFIVLPSLKIGFPFMEKITPILPPSTTNVNLLFCKKVDRKLSLGEGYKAHYGLHLPP